MSDVTDLIDTDEPIVTNIDFNAQPERRPQLNKEGYEKGVCRVCGQDAATPSGTYCAEHKTRQVTPKDTTNTPTGTSTVARTRSGRGSPTGDEWAGKVFDKAVILMTALFAGSMVRRYGLNDPNDDIADSLTMEADEARRVARPIGRMVAGTNFSRKQGRKILENSDLLDAGFALYDYFDRVNKTLRQHTASQPLASVTPLHTPEGGESGPFEPETSQSGNTGGGGDEFPDFTGSNFVI